MTNSRHDPSLTEREQDALDHIGSGHCLFCTKKISLNAYYCNEDCEVKFNGKSELDKWSEVHDSAVTINEFMDFLSQKGIVLCELDKEYEAYYPTLQKRDDLIYECYGIDFNKLESERRELLEQIRRKQQLVKSV